MPDRTEKDPASRLLAVLLVVVLLALYPAAYIFYRQTHVWEPLPLAHGSREQYLMIPHPGNDFLEMRPFTARLPWYIFHPLIRLDTKLTGIRLDEYRP